MESLINQTSTGTTSKQLTYSDHSVKNRRAWLLDQYLSGRYVAHIRDEYMEKYQLSEASFEADVVKVNKSLKTISEMRIEDVVNHHLNIAYEVVAKAKDIGDGKMVLQGLRHVEDLLKLHNKTSTGYVNIQVNNHTVNADLSNRSLEEIKELIKDVRNSAGATDDSEIVTDYTIIQ